MAGYDKPLLMDWSAFGRWARAATLGTGNGRLSQADFERFTEAVAQDDLYVCPPFRLEVLYSAITAKDRAETAAALDSFPEAEAGEDTFALALDAQRALADAKSVSHRVKPIDLLLAAIAHRNGLGILHYDKDYDTLAKHSGLTIESVWIATVT
jgi:predicted nucleic acid-binding protein